MTQRTNHSKNIYISREEVVGRIPLDDSISTTCVTNHIVEMTVMEKQISRKWCCIIKVDTLFSRILIYNHNQYENRRKTYGTESKIL